LAAGLSIGSGLELNGPETLLELWDPNLKTKMAMLGAMTLVMLIVHFKAQHFLAMPITLLFLPVVFFCVVAAFGISVDDCRSHGWLPPAEGSAAVPGFGVFDLFEPSSVHWDFLPKQLLSVVGLTLIVCFGSSLDISAIQAEMEGQKIDYNSELVTIGVGNCLSGLTGGSTGSYIFSQTIFSAKRGVKSRWNGLIVCAGEFALFLLPIDILAVLPNSYIGGIMCLFGIDIMMDWLFKSKDLSPERNIALSGSLSRAPCISQPERLLVFSRAWPWEHSLLRLFSQYSSLR
jgi:SulP family sulfate permease